MSNAQYKGKSNGKPNNKNWKKKNSNHNGKSKSKDTKSSREERSDKPDTAVRDYVGSENDPKWYNRNARLIQDAAKIPFSNQLGADLQFQPEMVPALNTRLSNDSVPGIMALQMINSPGIAVTASDGANIATAGIFQYIRRNLSTVATYAPADVMIVMQSIDEVYSMYANIARIFGIINAYSAINLYIPNTILKAGYGFSDAEIVAIKTGINDYRAQFNNLIFKASTLYLPTDFTVTSRHAWLYSNYFTDADEVKAQIYIHRMMYNRIWDETESSEGSYLSTAANPTTLTGLLARFNDMIDALRNSDSVLKIQADMRRAFEDKQSWKLAYVDEAFMVLPTFSEEVLHQLHNTNILPAIGNAVSPLDVWDITQDVNHNILQFTPYYQWADIAAMDQMEKTAVTYMSGSQYLNFYKPDVTSDDICEATRGKVALYLSYTAPALMCQVLRTGVDICVGAEMWNSSESLSLTQSVSVLTESAWSAKAIAFYSKFDWAPLILSEYEESGALMLVGTISDLGNYTTMDIASLVRLHDNILCSMYTVPELGEYTGKV